jgi:hypothetical protein
MMRIVAVWIACVLVLAGFAATHGIADDSRGGTDVHPAIAAFLSNAAPPVVSYRALRNLESAARGGRMRASLKAWTSLTPDEGFQYSVVEEEGSTLIRRKVLRAALEAERSIHLQHEDARDAIGPLNYDFEYDGEADGLVRIAIHPRRKAKMLIDGRLLVTPADADLVQIEGALVQRPSFWTRKVDIVRRYARLGGVRVPVEMRSEADVLLAGSATFQMTYDYETINGESIHGSNRTPIRRPSSVSSSRHGEPPTMRFSMAR